MPPPDGRSQGSARVRRAAPLLGSWFLAGFEGSTHRRRDGCRLDLVAATDHDRLAALDYDRMRRVGMRGARESLRWHLVERRPGRFDFSVELPRLRAARRAGVTVAWDLCHFGWPDWTDPFDDAFVDHYARWSSAVARFLAGSSAGPIWIAPQNEISFLAWAGGEVGAMNPFATGRGSELKERLIRATVAAIDAVRAVVPTARFLHPEPLINVAVDPDRPHERSQAAASGATAAQYEAWDMLVGRARPDLGGSEAHLDVIGVNYYPDNQWTDGGGALPLDDPRRVPLADQLVDLDRRYGRPIVITETGTEDGLRGTWLRMVRAEVDAAVRRGVPVGGICLYPILNHPGWENDRHCRNGLWDYAGPRGGRAIHRPLARQLVAPGPDAHAAHRPDARPRRRPAGSSGPVRPRRRRANRPATTTARNPGANS